MSCGSKMPTSKCDQCSYYMIDLQIGGLICTYSPIFDCDVYREEHGLRKCEEFKFMVINGLKIPIKN